MFCVWPVQSGKLILQFFTELAGNLLYNINIITGIFVMLDDKCRAPFGVDDNFIQKPIKLNKFYYFYLL